MSIFEKPFVVITGVFQNLHPVGLDFSVIQARDTEHAESLAKDFAQLLHKHNMEGTVEIMETSLTKKVVSHE